MFHSKILTCYPSDRPNCTCCTTGNNLFVLILALCMPFSSQLRRCRCNLYFHACFHVCTNLSHPPKSISPWRASKLSFSLQVFPCAVPRRAAQAGLRTQQLCTQQGFPCHVPVPRTQNLLSDMPQQHLWCLRHREHPGLTEQHINQLLR